VGRASLPPAFGLHQQLVHAALPGQAPLQAERARIVQLLVERVDIDPTGFRIRLRTNGIVSLVRELCQPAEDAA